jgi:hypothetical protein
MRLADVLAYGKSEDWSARTEGLAEVRALPSPLMEVALQVYIMRPISSRLPSENFAAKYCQGHDLCHAVDPFDPAAGICPDSTAQGSR